MRDSPTHKEQRAQNTMSDHMPFPFNNFTYFFTLFSKFFSSFHHCTCSLSVSRQYLALDGIYHPLRAAFPNNSTLRRHFTKNRTPRHTGFSPSMTSCSKEHRQGTAPKLPSPNYNSGTEGTRFPESPPRGPLHSPLLRQSRLVSFPPLIDMLKFSGYSYLI